MAESDIAVKVQHLTKTFKVPIEAHSGLKQKLINGLRGRRGYREFKPLNDVSLEIKKGEFFGIVGRNGSGKSTLLKSIAGIYAPTKGGVKVNGKLIPFIELGVGFNPELTGRENLFLNGALLGFSRKEMEAMYDEIVDFAELHDFMEERLKNYSSGMQVRLAFSIAIRAKGDILLLDEVLAVGDAIFQQKCFNYFHQLRKNKKTVLLVSHDVNVLRQYCSRGALIESGEIVGKGPINDILNQYIDIISAKENTSNGSSVPSPKEKIDRHGTGKILIQSLRLKDENNKDKQTFEDDDQNITVELSIVAKETVESPVYGLTIRDTSGSKVFTSNNMWLSLKAKDVVKGETASVLWKVPNFFNTGEYFISLAVADSFGKEVYDSIDEFGKFKVRKQQITSGIINVEHSMTIDYER